jgi:predicted PurR-regulated permease PerM
VATTYGLLLLLSASRPVLVLVGLALFLAIGLDPAVRWLNRWLPRRVAVAVATLTMLGVVAGFLAAAIPPLTTQTAHHGGFAALSFLTARPSRTSTLPSRR